MIEKIDENVIFKIGKFSLLWNVFEREIFGSDLHMKDIKNKRTDDFQVTEVLLKYSKDLRSYILKYPENKLFKKIVTKNLLNNVGNLTVDDVENPTSICRKWLLNEGNFDVKALFVALYRIRNNLFHGNKLLNDIQTQHELFEIVINWLSEFLDSNNISLI